LRSSCPIHSFSHSFAEYRASLFNRSGRRISQTHTL
jgi:hypothetical protein